MFKHIGIYAYRKAFLERFSQLSPGVLEQAERLEQLRALEHGYAVKVGETEYDTIGVDTPEDLEQVKKCLSIFS
jgi:3-deoxy-manno-octulosonate cytidylyltransferase (CMP-KDO synthetase)